MSEDSIQFFERLNANVQLRASQFWEPALTRVETDRANVPAGFEIGADLRDTVEEIAACGTDLMPLAGAPLSDQIAKLLEDLRQLTTRIAVVGQIKAGKSSFINALTGRTDFLPTHVNPWTAVPTKLYFSVRGQPKTGALFEFFSEREWGRLGQTLTGSVTASGAGDRPNAATDRTVWRRALLRLGERYHHLLGDKHRYNAITPTVLSHYLCAGPTVDEPSRVPQPGRYADITRLAHVYLPMEPFATPTILIDTPGLNDPTFIRIKTTQNILELADVYVVILTASQPLAFTDIALLRQLRGLEKRRFLVFINRIDELDGGLADVEGVLNHVRGKLRREFPGASISVSSGSAFWANAAIDGSAAQLREIAGSASFGAIAGDIDPELGGDVDALRAAVFNASGFPELSRALSEVMQASFLSSTGAKAISTLVSAAEVSASAARRELRTLRQLGGQAKSRAEVVDFRSGIAQLEMRIEALAQTREKIAALIEQSEGKIQVIRETQSMFIRDSIQNLVDAFAREQKKRLLRQLEEVGKSHWRCDTNVLLNQLEAEFLRLFTAAITDIAAVHDECIGMVKSAIRQHYSRPDPPLDAKSVVQPDIRGALPALGGIIEVEIGQPWWLTWWGSGKTLDEKANELEQKILREFTPIAQSLAGLAQDELTAFAGHARSTLVTVASSTISGTAARLYDLRSRLQQHSMEERGLQPGTLGNEYADSIRELTHVLARCEAVTDRLHRLGAVRA
jgi:hypothetical protein